MGILLNIVSVAAIVLSGYYQDHKAYAIYSENVAALEVLESAYGRATMDEGLLLLERYVDLSNEFLKNSKGYADGYYLWGLFLAHGRLFIIHDLREDGVAATVNRQKAVACRRLYEGNSEKSDEQILGDILNTIISIDENRVSWMRDARARYLDQ